MNVQTGLEALLADPTAVRGKRIGLLTHQAAVTRDLRRAIDLLDALDGCELVRIFEPEHGMWAVAQDMEGLSSERDAPTGLPVVSLYAHTSNTGGKEGLAAAKKQLWPRRDDLEGLDAIVVDLQDVGSRYYTFANTMAYCMEVANQCGAEVIVLDRPNPINGVTVEGNILETEWASFVGHFPIPVRHGLSIGELARLYQTIDARYGCALHVVQMRGWTRRMWWDQTGLPWVAPSPNVPTPATATVYPGMCLIEATEASEGRGTTQPFELFGAPGVDPFALAKYLEALNLPGVIFRPQYFKPTFQKQAMRLCGGVQLHVTDRESFRAYETGLFCTAAIAALWPDFEWRSAPYEYESADEKPAINLLAGSSKFREIVESRGDVRGWIAGWDDERMREFRRMRDAALLY